MAYKFAVLAAFAGCAIAQASTVIELTAPGLKGSPGVTGSVKTVSSGSTVVVIGCAKDVEDCGLGVASGVEVMTAPGTVSYSLGTTHINTPSTSSSSTNTLPTGTGAAGIRANCSLPTASITASNASCTIFIDATPILSGKPLTTVVNSTVTNLPVETAEIFPVTLNAGVEKLSSGGGKANATSSSTGGVSVPKVTQQAVLAGIAAVVGGAVAMA